MSPSFHNRYSFDRLNGPKSSFFYFLSLSVASELLILLYLTLKVVEAALVICWFRHLPTLYLSASSRISKDASSDFKLDWSVQSLLEFGLATNMFWYFPDGLLLYGMLLSS